MKKLADKVQSIINLSNYESDQILKSYMDASKQYQQLIEQGLAEPKKRNLPNMQERVLLRKKAECNYINIGR